VSSFCDASDLEAAVGGAAVLRQLLDLDQDQIADAALVTKALDAGASRITCAIQGVIDPAAITAPYEQSLVDANSIYAAEWAYLFGTGGQAMPTRLEKMVEWANGWLERVRTRQATLGSTLRSSAQLVEQVYKTSTESHESDNSPRRRYDGWA
jgi:hypothetical protein